MKTTTHETIRPLVTLLFALTMVALSTTSSLAMGAAEMAYDPCWDAECLRDADCGEGFLCDGADTCTGVCVAASEEALMCQASGGAWDACGFIPYTACSDCVPACICPAGMRMEGEGCVDCEGGECSNPQSFDGLCEETGGTSGCAPCESDEVCPAICMMVCECPAGLYWDGIQGCIEAPELGERCVETGGVMGCEPIACAGDDPGCGVLAMCNDWCYCPAGQAYDPLCGCIDSPVEPVVIEEPPFEGCSQSGMGPMGLFGCSGGGSGAPDASLLLCLCLAMVLSRRTASMTR